MLHDLFDELDTCPVLELKRLRFRHLNLLLAQIRRDEHTIKWRKFLYRLPYCSVQRDEMFVRLVSTYNVPHFRLMARMNFPMFLGIVALI